MSEPEGPPPPAPPDKPVEEPAAEPVLPTESIDPDAALREAVGASANPPPRAPTPLPVSDDDYDGELPALPGKRRRTVAVAAGAILAGLAIAALVFLGRANSERYLITCTTDHVAAEQGRGFPPWGSHELSGPEWKRIALPPNAECTARETDDPTELEGWYLDALIDRASATLGNKDMLDTIAPAAGSGSAAPNVLDTSEQQLDQALLLARSPEHRDQRKAIERLQGDIAYWRAALRLRDASSALADAAKQFDAAATRRPAHATDAAAWATFLRRVGDELHGGPAGGPPPDQFPPQPPMQTPGVPVGVALPVEPPAGSAAEPPPPAIDAGVPTGGVLL
jgi:hypothetical protein